MLKLYCALLPIFLVSSALAAPKEKDDFDAKVKKSTETAIASLKKLQQEDGGWEGDPAFVAFRGGVTALAILALLENSVAVEDIAVVKGLKVIRELDTKQTYVISLQTMVLCKANQKRDREQIQKNVDWLMSARVLKSEALTGWTYNSGPTGRADNSCTAYAVMALRAAKQAGAKVDEKLWKDLRDLYLRTQHNDGGWGYMPENASPTTQTMTMAGMNSLLTADELLGDTTDASKKSVQQGFGRLLKDFEVMRQTFTGYNLFGIARLGKLRGGETIFAAGDKKIDWYREGVQGLLKVQRADGSFSFQGCERPPLATSFALIFFAAGK